MIQVFCFREIFNCNSCREGNLENIRGSLYNRWTLLIALTVNVTHKFTFCVAANNIFHFLITECFFRYWIHFPLLNRLKTYFLLFFVIHYRGFKLLAHFSQKSISTFSRKIQIVTLQVIFKNFRDGTYVGAFSLSISNSTWRKFHNDREDDL